MNRYRTLRASLLATTLIFSLTSGAYAQRWEPLHTPIESTNSWPVTSGAMLVRDGDNLVWVPSSSVEPLILRGQNEKSVLNTKPAVAPDQMDSPTDIPNIQLPPIPFDSTSILSAPDLAYLDRSQFVFRAKDDVFNGKVFGRDDGILLKSWNGWDHDYDPGIVWHGRSDSLVVIAQCFDSLIRSSGSFSINEGDVRGSFSIGENGIITTDSVVNGGSFSNGPIISGSIVLGDAFGLGGQKHDHYYLKDGKRYYMQYTWPDKTAPKMEERVGTSDIWLIGGSTAIPKK